MVNVPVAAFAGIAIVSTIVIESRNGLENSTESLRATGPVEVKPSERTLSGAFPLTVTTIDFPSTAELPEVGLITFWSLAMSFVATLPPAWRASRLDPVEALRYE